MAQLAVLMAGLVLMAESQASDLADRSTLQGFLSKYVPSGSDVPQSSMSDYDKFITPNFNRVNQGNGPDALSYHHNVAEHGPFTIVDDEPVLHVNKEENQAAQKLLANNSNNPISLSAIGIGLLSLATMLGVRLWRGLQSATVLANSGRLETDMGVEAASASGDNTLELDTQASTTNSTAALESGTPRKENSRGAAWGQMSSATSSALQITRRSLLPAAATMAVPAAAHASASRTEGYAVQKSEAEWQRQLSGPEYFILRNGGTEPPNSSPLVKEKRAGEFRCAGCGVPLFTSAAKFESGTGWPSFANQLPAVAVESSPLEFLAGAEIRCGRCGGHLGDRFLDGLMFPGTPAALSGQRYCVDGTAVVFYPADGSAPVRGEFENKPRELPKWAQPPGVKVNS